MAEEGEEVAAESSLSSTFLSPHPIRVVVEFEFEKTRGEWGLKKSSEQVLKQGESLISGCEFLSAGCVKLLPLGVAA